MIEEEDIVRETAEYDGFSAEDGLAARDLLNLGPKDLVVRFQGLASFAKKYGVDLRALAEFISQTTTGIEPWGRPRTYSSEEKRKIDEALVGFGGDWIGAILRLQEEVERLREAGGTADT